MAEFREDWREKCCKQCKHHYIEYKGDKFPCTISLSSDEEIIAANEGGFGCQGIKEYCETGIFPERGRKF